MYSLSGASSQRGFLCG